MVLEKFLRCRPMDLQVRRAIHIAVRVFRDRGGVRLGASAVAVLLLRRRLRWLEFRQLELLSDVILANLYVVAREAVQHEAALCVAARLHGKRPIVLRMSGAGGAHAAVDNLAAEQASHFRQCWERCWHDLARRLLTFSRRPNQARLEAFGIEHSLSRSLP